MRQVLSSTVLVLALVVGFAASASAQVEVGASLAGVTFVTQSGDTITAFGVPSGSFGMLTPATYVSVFLTRSVAAEGTLGFASISGGGDSVHLLNAAGQVAWFMKGEASSSPYVFGSVGVIHATDSDAMATFGAGGGYRFKCGDRLALRLQGRYTFINNDGGHVFDVSVSIGGLFGK